LSIRTYSCEDIARQSCAMVVRRKKKKKKKERRNHRMKI